MTLYQTQTSAVASAARYSGSRIRYTPQPAYAPQPHDNWRLSSTLYVSCVHDLKYAAAAVSQIHLEAIRPHAHQCAGLASRSGAGCAWHALQCIHHSAVPTPASTCCHTPASVRAEVRPAPIPRQVSWSSAALQSPLSAAGGLACMPCRRHPCHFPSFSVCGGLLTAGSTQAATPGTDSSWWFSCEHCHQNSTSIVSSRESWTTPPFVPEALPSFTRLASAGTSSVPGAIIASASFTSEPSTKAGFPR